MPPNTGRHGVDIVLLVGSASLVFQALPVAVAPPAVGITGAASTNTFNTDGNTGGREFLVVGRESSQPLTGPSESPASKPASASARI